MESELFGYEKGAFTGADKSKKGLIAEASFGTFFLDEISEMPLSMQVKVLRVLEEKEFYPVGGRQVEKMNARIIAASNKNLEQEVKNGRFREDLYYRIHVIPIKLPTLNERKEDIPILSRHFRIFSWADVMSFLTMLVDFSNISPISLKTISAE